MYCSNCGTQNKEEANYCRRCGQSFHKPTTSPLTAEAQRNLARGIKKLLIGIALLVVAFIPLLEGEPVIWWLLFPGLPMLAKGIRLLSAVRFEAPPSLATVPFTGIQAPPPPQTRPNFRAKPTGELVPPSVTERTTKLFDRQ